MGGLPVTDGKARGNHLYRRGGSISPGGGKPYPFRGREEVTGISLRRKVDGQDEAEWATGMIKYLVLLAIISSIITIACRYFQKYLPINIRVVYVTIGVSFILTAFFPLVLASFKMPVVILIYLFLFLIPALVVGWIQGRCAFERPEAERPFHEILAAGLARRDALRANPKEKKNAAVPENPGPEHPAPVLPEGEFPGRQSAGGSAAAEGLQEPAVSAAPEVGERQLIENFSGLAGEEPAAPTVPAVPAVPAERTALPAVIGEAAGPVTPDEVEQVGREVVSTVDDYIAKGFAARETGNYVDAVEYFLKALLSNPGQQLKALLALEISAVYQQLGQYRQAVMLLEAMLAPESGIHDRALRQQLYERKVNLEVTAELLKTARQPNTPYAAVPSLIKVKAGVETAERLKSKREEKVN